MSERIRRYYAINGRAYFEDDIVKSGGYVMQYPYNISQEGGPCWGTGCLINDDFYTEQELRKYLRQMTENGKPMYLNGFYKLTRKELEEILSPKPPTPGTTKLLDVAEISNTLGAIQKRWDGTQGSDSDSEITQTTLSTGGGMDTPRALEGEDEEDELLNKIIENLHLKVQAVKRCKRLEAEVEGLRKVLAEKEADLVECQRIVALEAGQVQA